MFMLMSKFRRFAAAAAITAAVGVGGVVPVFAQGTGTFTDAQYKKALWMVTRFYGAQRSGHGPNWLIMEHENPAYRKSFLNDADGTHNLEGGWFDCADHVLFGHTFFYSAYMLAKAYETFPEGFHDLYRGWDYSDYVESAQNSDECKDWNINCGKPDGIPDLLQELKYATDWIIKATPNANTFYFEKGHGDKDHQTWVTAGKMSTQPVDKGGEPREIWKNPNDGVMPSFAASALAVMSRIYRKYDAAYADKCLTHAQNAYQYASGKKNNSEGAKTGPFYGAHKDPATVFLTATAEMYMATNSNTYKNAIDETQIKDHFWAFDYSNSHDLAAYAAAMALPEKRNTHLDYLRETFIEGKYTKSQSINAEKVATVGNSDWGMLRYPANHAFIAALYSSAKNVNTYDQFIYNQIDFILGENNANQSFVVGFTENGKKSIKLPHHRNVFLNDDNVDDDGKAKLPIPKRNTYFGYMVGGNWNSTSYVESVIQYKASEGGLDYNAGLLGALAYIVSKSSAKADTGSFGTSIAVPSARKGLAARGGTISVKQGSVDFRAAEGLKISSINVYNPQGRRVFNMAGGRSEIRWNTANQPRGMYLTKVILSNGAVLRKNLILK